LLYQFDLDENSNFHVFDNIFINVHADVLYVVLKSSEQAQVDEDDDSNVEDCVGVDDESIEEEKDNSD